MERPDQDRKAAVIDRRAFLASITAGLGSLAGCDASGKARRSTPASTDSSSTDTRSSLTTGVGAESASENWPVIGIDVTPKSLNPLTGSGSFITEILYTRGTTFDPKTYAFSPWAFKDWTLIPDNVGTSSPALIGELRSDMTFTDGTPITAEDARFTIEFIKEQEVAGGSVGASQFDSVESIQVDSRHGTTVNYYFSEEDNGWFSHILGQLLLPRHVWRHVADYSQYSPRKESKGLVGSGPYSLENYAWANWFELARRPKKAIWQTDANYTDWFQDSAPFLNGIRVDVFGSNDDMRRAVLAGDIDAALGSVTLDDAIRASERESVEAAVSPSDGWKHHSFNLRRVPLDDRAFRQFLVMTVDSSWITDVLRGGIGAQKGTYATPKAYEQWRPPEPREQDAYRGIPTPTLSFPGEPGSFHLDAHEVEEVRDFLSNHEDAMHDYTWREPAIGNSSPSVKDNKFLHVNGRPFKEAHTDNEDNPGQGALEVSINPPGEDLPEIRIANQWAATLVRIGVPIEIRIRSTPAQVQAVYSNEDFDIFSMGWSGIPVNNAHFKQLFGRWGADLDGTSESPMFNPMGYTGADDLIERQASLMDNEQRKPIVKRVLATIWNDAPTHVLRHDSILQPVSSEWTGWIETIGGILHTGSFLNLRRRGEDKGQ